MIKYVNRAVKFIFVWGCFFGLYAFSACRSVKTSIIIPCHVYHFKYLETLLTAYEQQTVLPDEVVISLSSVKEPSDKQLVTDLQKRTWKFPVVWLVTHKQQYVGENRNIACAHAQGDVFLLQDGDDLPYSRRVEIVKNFFEQYDIDFLLHGWATDIRDVPLKWGYFRSVAESDKQGCIQYGTPCLRKELFLKLKWTKKPRGADMVFVDEVKNYLTRCKRLGSGAIVIYSPLYLYRPKLSAIKFAQAGK